MVKVLVLEVMAHPGLHLNTVNKQVERSIVGAENTTKHNNNEQTR